MMVSVLLAESFRLLLLFLKPPKRHVIINKERSVAICLKMIAGFWMVFILLLRLFLIVLLGLFYSAGENSIEDFMAGKSIDDHFILQAGKKTKLMIIDPWKPCKSKHQSYYRTSHSLINYPLIGYQM